MADLLAAPIKTRVLHPEPKQKLLQILDLQRHPVLLALQKKAGAWRPGHRLKPQAEGSLPCGLAPEGYLGQALGATWPIKKLHLRS
jgi:hypothetical protein